MQTIRLEDGLSVLIDYRGKSPPRSLIGIPVISAKVVKNGRVLRPIEQKIAPDYYKTWMTRGFPRPGDIVLTTEGPLGEVAQLDEETASFAIAQRVVVLRGKDGILDNLFLKFLLLSPKQQAVLSSFATGTTVEGISQKALRSVPVRIPSFEQQRAIASVLGALDDKIEINHQLNDTLEAVAATIFKDWFVDFGPVHAKMENRDPPSLAPEIAAFFPDRLNDDGRPEGWEERRVDDVLELAYGKALKATEREDGPFPVYGSGGVTGYHNAPLLDGPSIIVGRKGTVGSLYWEDRPFFPIDTVFYVKPKAPLTFCYYLLRTLGLEGMNTDAAVPGLNRNNVYRLPVPWGPNYLRSAFDNAIKPIRQKIRSNIEETHSLAALRDLLLPKLMSGEILIKAAEKAVGEIT